MIKSYLKTAWRNLLKNKVFSFINIMGLSLGITICFVIMLFVQDEVSYDRYNHNADNIYRMVFKANINGGKIDESVVMAPVAGTLQREFPEVESVTRIRTIGRPKIVYNNQTFREGQSALVDSNFFSIFNIQLLKGDKRTVLQEPNAIVLTGELAHTIFGNDDPMGKLVNLNGASGPLKVTGVMDKMPANSHFHFDLLLALSGFDDSRSQDWLASNYHTYLALRKGYDYKKLEAKFPAMVEKYMGPQIQQAMGLSLTQFRSKGNELGFRLQPLTSIHLHPDTTTEFEAGGDLKYIYIFSAVGIFMLLLACINFINLSTAGAAKRAKEVGVRKVIGSRKFDLVKQFLLESMLISFIALLISAVLVQLTLPLFNSLSGKNLVPGFSIRRLAEIAGLGILVGILAGIYPAFFLSSFKPITTLKGKYKAATKMFSLRSGLVVFQFFISICLIMGTIVVFRQMKYIQNKKLGYNKDQLIVLPESWSLGKNERLLRDELLNDSRIANVTVSSYRPAGYSDNNNALAYPEGKDAEPMKTLEYKVDERYIPTLGIQIAAGRNFAADLPSDSLAMIINESAAKAFGFGNNAIGQRIVRQNSDRGRNVIFTVIGVVKDFHFKSLHESISPLLMVVGGRSGIIIKTKTKDVAGLIATLKERWTAFGAEEPFSYVFMDDLYNKTYIAEQKTGQLLNIFAVLTVLVACMGLFGLATHTSEQRAKEIGIRKVLGASSAQMTGMLSKDFLQLVLVACVIAFPFSYWIMQKWLQDFAYRTTINWWVFIAAGGAAVLTALLTVGFKTLRAAMTSPVKNLRSE